MRKLSTDQNGQTQMIGLVVGVLVTIIIAVLVFYNIAGSIDYDGLNEDIAENVYGLTENTDEYNNTVPVTNATDDTLDQAGTFFQIVPIIAIVLIAVIILGYVSKMNG